MELILVRHGLPERSGETSDPPLSDEGHDQAAAVARWLAAERVDAIWSSPMKRAIQTAEPFARHTGHTLRHHEGIAEFDRHSGEYVPMEQLKAENYEAWKAFVDGGLDVDMAGFQAEVVAALEQLIAEHAGQRIAVFCHGGVINVWAAHVLGTPPRLFFEPAYTSIHRFMCARSGQRNVLSLNETAHLRP